MHRLRLPIRDRAIRASCILAGLISAMWLALLAAQPVHIPLFEFPQELIPSHTQSLSGVKGQTIVAPYDGISRIDVWTRTEIPSGENIHVTFDLKPSMQLDESIATGIVVFDRSSSAWQVRLLLDTATISKGDFLYLRLESVLSSGHSDIYYEYFGRNSYKSGELLELDRVEVRDQDLRFKLYRSPSLPKPLAWVEAAIAPAALAAAKSNGPPGWFVGTLVILLGAGGAAVVVVVSVLAARMLTVGYRREVSVALALVLLALMAAIMAGSEAPLGKLWVPLT